MRFLRKIIDYFRGVIRASLPQNATHSIGAVVGFQPPTNLAKLSLLLDLYKKLRHPDPSYARIAAPFNRKTCKGKPSNIGKGSEVEMHSLNRLKDAPIPSSILTLPISSERITIDTPCDIHLDAFYFISKQTRPQN